MGQNKINDLERSLILSTGILSGGYHLPDISKPNFSELFRYVGCPIHHPLIPKKQQLFQFILWRVSYLAQRTTFLFGDFR